MWSIIGGALGLFKAGLEWLGLREKRKAREDQQELGANREKLQQHKEAEDARDAFGSVDYPSDFSKRLRDDERDV